MGRIDSVLAFLRPRQSFEAYALVHGLLAWLCSQRWFKGSKPAP